MKFNFNYIVMIAGLLAYGGSSAAFAGCGEERCLPEDLLFIAQGKGCPNGTSDQTRTQGWEFYLADPNRVDAGIACDFMAKESFGHYHYILNLANGAALDCNPSHPSIVPSRSNTRGNQGDGFYEHTLCEKTQQYLHKLQILNRTDFAVETRNYLNYLVGMGRNYPFPLGTGPYPNQSISSSPSSTPSTVPSPRFAKAVTLSGDRGHTIQIPDDLNRNMIENFASAGANLEDGTSDLYAVRFNDRWAIWTVPLAGTALSSFSSAVAACQHLGARLPTKEEYENLIGIFARSDNGAGELLSSKEARDEYFPSIHPNITLWTGTVSKGNNHYAYQLTRNGGLEDERFSGGGQRTKANYQCVMSQD